MNWLKRLKRLWNFRKQTEKSEGFEVVCSGGQPPDPRELKGVKLVDCSFQQGGCPFLAEEA